MNRCKTCKYWSQDREDEFELSGDDIGKCTNNKISENDSNDNDFREANKLDMLIYKYYEGGTFYTGSEFGCVHHKEEAKNEQAN